MTKLSNKRSFLLLECIVTIALLVVFSSGLFISYRWLSHFVVHTELNALMIFFQYMQQRAIVGGKDCTVIIDSERQSYCIKGEQETLEHVLPRDIRFMVLPGVKGPPSYPKQYPEKPVTFVGSEITFYKTGIISSGILYIADVISQNQYAISNAVSSYSTLRLYRYIKDEKWQLL